jgi:hypothetical protein
MRDQQKMEVLLKGKNTKKEMSNAKKGMRWETGYVLPSGTAPPPSPHPRSRQLSWGHERAGHLSRSKGVIALAPTRVGLG